MPRRDNDWVGALYDAHAESMYAYALSLLGRVEEAEDVVQDVFVRVCRSGRAPENPRHYLLRSVRNEAYSRLRKRRLRFWKRAKLVRESVFFARAGHEAGDVEAVEAAFKRLPVEQREAVVLKIYEGLTFQEIAAVTGVGPNTAASRYRYAIEKLRGLLDEEQAHEQ